MAQKNVKRFISQKYLGYGTDGSTVVQNLVEYEDGSTGILYYETAYGGMQTSLQEECPYVAHYSPAPVADEVVL